ncbi:MAG: hypothetical protein ACI9TV_001004 [Sulfurimonas sp.]|jgi:hypothetical protein|uniref:hypothetical protein n=1 Tax=Sulfurimonas sp. TaxID=2022749 RepID=UPI0039E57401
MYSFITTKPTQKDIKAFKMQEYSNENFINYKVDPTKLSLKDKELFILNYQLDEKANNYKDFIFLSMPLSTLRVNE